MNYNFRDRTGERYGKLTVIKRVEDAVFPSGKLVKWLCQCDCGNYVEVIGCNLSKTISCGCYQDRSKRLQDLSGQRFGMLTVIERAENQILPSGQRQTMWKCRCDCGSIVIVRGTHLKNGATKSCGCIKSFAEQQIAEYLTSQNIQFQREYMFDDCINSKGNPVLFDFAIYDNEILKCLIEFQGEQHFKAPKTSSTFGKLQREETDQLKREYCKQHLIPLFEIKYNENIIQKLDSIILWLHDNTVPSTSDDVKV